MILNGIDIVKIDRFKELINNDTFMNKNFNEEEIKYINNNI